MRDMYELSQEVTKNKREFIQIRELINELDSRLSYILFYRTAVVIYGVLINLYVIAMAHKFPKMMTFAQMLGFGTITLVTECVISCFVCGSLHEKSEQIYAVLDEFNANDLSDYEFREWLMFKECSNKSKFGFTIGGFAPMKKTTLIPVSFICKVYMINNYF